jgi:hypothetical protein
VGKQLLHAHRSQGRDLKQLRFVWAVRDQEMVQDIPPLLLNQEPHDDYSTASPDYQRMIERSQSFRRKSGTCKSMQSLSSTDASQLSDTTMESKESGKSPMRRRPAVVQADIYCTRKSEEAGDPEADRRLPYNLYNGRPDLDKIFEEMKEDAVALGETSVAVIGCGPPSLILAVQEACRKHSASIVGCRHDGIFFDLHTEHFEL